MFANIHEYSFKYSYLFTYSYSQKVFVFASYSYSFAKNVKYSYWFVKKILVNERALVLDPTDTYIITSEVVLIAI